MDKRSLISELQGYSATDIMVKVRLLLQYWVNDLRIKNDTALPEEVLKYQGAIRELNLILKKISLGEKQREYNSAFDE